MVDGGFFITTPLFSEFILPFLLVFVLIFAILERSKVLGEGKMQVNALVSLAISLIFIAFESARQMVAKFVPVLVVTLVAIFVFILLYALVSGNIAKEKGILPSGLVITFGIIIGIVLIFATGVITGVIPSWDVTKLSKDVWVNILFFALLGGGLALVISTAKKKD